MRINTHQSDPTRSHSMLQTASRDTMCYRVPDPDVTDVTCPLQTSSLDSVNPIPRTSATDPFVYTIVNDSPLESRCFPFNIMFRLEINLDWYATATIPQELISSDATPTHCKGMSINSYDYANETITSHGTEDVIWDVFSFVVTNSISLPKMRRDKLDLITCIQEKPTHLTTEKRKWNASIWCENAPKHNYTQVTQHQSVCVDMEHNQRDETDSIVTDHIAHKMTRSDARSTSKCVDIVFVLLTIWLTLFGYRCLFSRASCDVIEPPHINHNQSDSVHLPLQRLGYTHHASTAQSTRRSNKDLYNSLKQNQEAQNYIQIIGSFAAALCGLFVSQSRTFKVFSFIAFNLLISGRAQYINCTGSWASAPCDSKTVSCDRGNATANCTIDCIGNTACFGADIYGGAGSLSINCHGYRACYRVQIHSANATTFIDARGEDSLWRAIIWCNTTEYCGITARGKHALRTALIYADVVNGTKLFVNARGEEALWYTVIYCPKDYIPGVRYSNDALCNIYAKGLQVMLA
eukprot:699590_1